METSKEEQDQNKKWRNTKERRGEKVHSKDPSKGKANEKQSGSNATEEKQCNGKGKDLEKEVVSSNLSEKDNAHLVQSDSGANMVKEGGNKENSEEESDTEGEE